MMRAADDLVKYLLSFIKIKVSKLSSGKLNFASSFCPAPDWRAVNLNLPSLSLSKIKLTQKLQKLQKPSKRIIYPVIGHSSIKQEAIPFGQQV